MELLILTQIGIDIVIISVFIVLIKRLRSIHRNSVSHNGLKEYESLLIEADKVSDRFKEQLEEKQQLIKRLMKQLDKKIMSLNVNLNRADTLLHHNLTDNGDRHLVSAKDSQKKIMNLAQEDCTPEEIADTLAIPKEQVLLVLDLNKNRPNGS